MREGKLLADMTLLDAILKARMVEARPPQAGIQSLLGAERQLLHLKRVWTRTKVGTGSSSVRLLLAVGSWMDE